MAESSPSAVSAPASATAGSGGADTGVREPPRRAGDVVAPLVLAALAVAIWLRDRSWLTRGEDALPIVAALPLFWLLGRPWQLRPPARAPSLTLAAIGVALMTLGVPTDLTVLLAVGWTALLWCWLSPRLDDAVRPRVRRLLVLPVMAFPWVTLDGAAIGNLFRLSGAAATAACYALLGFSVQRDGTVLTVDRQPISVEAACAGLNTLQSLLVMGTLAASVTLGRSRRFWLALPLLVGAAWIGNTVRIIVIAAIALTFGPDVARGPAHGISGWAVLLLTFVLTALLFEAMRPRTPTAAATERA